MREVEALSDRMVELGGTGTFSAWEECGQEQRGHRDKHLHE